MIKTISVTNPDNETLVLELARPDKSGFVVGPVTGLGPVKASINTTRLATMDGDIYNSARAESRNIVIPLVFLENPTIEDSRHLSYKYFPIKKNVKVKIETDSRVLETIGYVESNDPAIFAKDSSTQISIVCPDSYFEAAGGASGGFVDSEFYSVTPLLEFPVENPSLTVPLIQLGEATVGQGLVVEYDGDVPSGLEIFVSVIGAFSGFSIYEVATGLGITLNQARLNAAISSTPEAGDSFYISTHKGKKRILYTRGSTTYDIINALDGVTSWFELERGSQLIAYSATSGSDNLRVRLRHRPRYEGV